MLNSTGPATPLAYAPVELRPAPLEPSRRAAAMAMLIEAVLRALAPIAMLPGYWQGWQDALDADESWAIVVGFGIAGYLLLAAVAWVIMLVLFLLWFAAAHANIFRIGVRAPLHGTGWAVVSWFVPVVNLIVSMQALGDTYRCCVQHPQRAAVRPLYQWWALWVLSWITLSISLAVDI